MTDIRDAIEAALDWGAIIATEVSDGNEVRATVRGAGDGTTHEELADQQILGHAPLQYRPRPAATQSVEALVFRRGDELLILGTRDRRMLVELQEGEVVITNLNSGAPCRFRLGHNGSITLECETFAITDADGSVADKALALAEKCDDRITKLQTAHDTHKHPTAATGPASLPDIMVNGGVPLASVASDRISSKD